MRVGGEAIGFIIHLRRPSAGVRGRELRQATGKGHRVSSLSFHSFRHGAATAVFNAAALKEITRRVTGHAQRGSLERYVHQDVQALKAATALIPRLPKAQE
jgi:integrase